MVQDQLVDYISTQMKAGTSKEAIRTTLLGVGWQSTDVDDSFKKADGTANAPTAQPMAAAQPMSSEKPFMISQSGAASSISSSFTAKPVVASFPSSTTTATATATMPSSKPMSSANPQVIRMSDLVSKPSSPSMNSPLSSAASMTKFPAALNKKIDPGAMTFEAVAPAKSGSKPGLSMKVVGIVLIVVFAGVAGYLYMQNSSLAAQIGSANGQSQSVTSQISSLTAQVNALTASSTALATNMTALTAANQDLMTELSFYAVPLGSAAGATSKISVTGSLNVNASRNYFLVASYGGKIFIKNSADAKVIAALQPLVGTSTAQLSGTFIPGSDTMTVTGVNGTSL
jgi:hypothetical protein